ncbi:MAG: hypothetical protein QM726_23325 [Chitinophagaceae bacterium]
MKSSFSLAGIIVTAICLYGCISFCSCSVERHREYRIAIDSENVKRDGYVFSCLPSGNEIYVIIFTRAHNKHIYFNDLNGLPGNDTITIQDVKIWWASTGDTTTLLTRRNKRSYTVKQKNISGLVNLNPFITLLLTYDDNRVLIHDSFVLRRYLITTHKKLFSKLLLGTDVSVD